MAPVPSVVWKRKQRRAAQTKSRTGVLPSTASMFASQPPASGAMPVAELCPDYNRTRRMIQLFRESACLHARPARKCLTVESE